MILFSIPDIRQFWSTDSRFLDQFAENRIVKFQPYSRYPECYKDVSFWLPKDVGDEGKGEVGAEAAGGKEVEVVEGGREGKVFHENDFCEIVRDVAGDLIENVTLVRTSRFEIAETAKLI